MTLNILHIFPKKYKRYKNYYLGATKDIFGRTEYFKNRGISYKELLPENKYQYCDEIKKIGKNNLKSFSAVIVEMTFSPDAIQLLKNWSPFSKLIVRSHNAELLHRLDWTRTQGFSFGALKSFRHAVINTLCDYRCGKWSDLIASISRWETDVYWPYIANKAKIKWVPFYLPEVYAKEIRESRKKMRCVNFTASSLNPIITDATKNFISAVKNLNGQCKEWSFYITGNMEKNCLKANDRIEWTGFLKKPYDILSESRAIALLSDFGFGFKTKILEAILAKNFIIMTEGLFKRMPVEVTPYCIPVDIRSSKSFKEALDKCLNPYPEGNVNALLRKMAFSRLDDILL